VVLITPGAAAVWRWCLLSLSYRYLSCSLSCVDCCTQSSPSCCIIHMHSACVTLRIWCSSVLIINVLLDKRLCLVCADISDNWRSHGRLQFEAQSVPMIYILGIYNVIGLYWLNSLNYCSKYTWPVSCDLHLGRVTPEAATVITGSSQSDRDAICTICVPVSGRQSSHGFLFDLSAPCII